MSAQKPTQDRPAWSPVSAEGPNRCRRCQSHVTRQFRRTYGTGADEAVYGCHNCYSGAAIRRGATKPDCDGTLAEDVEAGQNSSGRAGR